MKEVGRRATDAERAALSGPPLFAGLCAGCEHLRLLASKTSVFVRCALAEGDPRFPRYPPLPVRICAGHRPSRS